ARTDEGDQEFADGRHTGVPEEKGSYSLLLSWLEWLSEATSIAALRPPGGPGPGAGQEVVAAFDEPETGADQHQRDEHRGHSLRDGRPGDLIQGQRGKRDHVSGDRHRVLDEHGPQRGVRGDPGLLQEVAVVTAPPADHLTR